MKRSEMVELIRTLIPDEFSIETIEDQTDIASYILKRLEDEGMLPPKMVGIYDNVPTVTPTGHHDYSWKRGWESENKEESLEQWKDNYNKGYIKDE